MRVIAEPHFHQQILLGERSVPSICFGAQMMNGSPPKNRKGTRSASVGMKRGGWTERKRRRRPSWRRWPGSTVECLSPLTKLTLTVQKNIQCIIFAGWEKTWCKIKYAAVQRLPLTCLASTSRVMKKMKRFTEPIVFRSFSTPGLSGERRDRADTVRELIYSGFTGQDDFKCGMFFFSSLIWALMQSWSCWAIFQGITVWIDAFCLETNLKLSGTILTCSTLPTEQK